MACIKCGKKLKNHNVFCEDCLAEAENYPIDPDTPLVVPKSAEIAPTKKRARKRPAPSPEEQLPRLRKAIRRLTLALLVLILLLLASFLLVWDLLQAKSHVRQVLPALAYSQSAENVSRETFWL